MLLHPRAPTKGALVPHTSCQVSDHFLTTLPLEVLPARVQPRRLLFWEVSSETLLASESSLSWRLGGRRAGLSFTCVWGAAPEDQLLHLEMAVLQSLQAGMGGWAVQCKVRQFAAPKRPLILAFPGAI